tara:strand:+ start:1247 stop:1537 length:291 start_codon:yes stop_codon:yes gene_type:complete
MEEIYTKSFECYLIGSLPNSAGDWEDFNGQKSTVKVEWRDHGEATSINVYLKDPRLDSVYKEGAVEGEHYTILPQVWGAIERWGQSLDDELDEATE